MVNSCFQEEHKMMYCLMISDIVFKNVTEEKPPEIDEQKTWFQPFYNSLKIIKTDSGKLVLDPVGD